MAKKWSRGRREGSPEGLGIGLREISGAFNPRRRKMYLPSLLRASVSNFLAPESSKARIVAHFLHYSPLSRSYIVSVDGAATLYVSIRPILLTASVN